MSAQLQSDLRSQLKADTQGFLKVTRWIHKQTSIFLPDNAKNRTLVASRLGHLIEQYGLPSYDALCELLEQNKTSLKTQVIQAITTNTTHFFREPSHFEYLKGIIENHDRSDFRFWSAAASHGHEVYSALMTAQESSKQVSHFAFLATDIDTQALEVAHAGLYSESVLQKVPKSFCSKYFVKDIRGGMQVKSEHRSMVRFAELNLSRFPYPFQKKFDVIFCRNVLIYFNAETVNKIVNEMFCHLQLGGYLFVGHSETGVVRHSGFERVQTAIYKKIKEAER